MELSVEIYKEQEKYCAYIGEECGSGYEIIADTEEECARKIGEYFADNGRWE